MENHLIYRQTLDLQLTSRAEALELQEQFKGWYYDQLLPVLTSLFDKLGSGKTIRIQRLELHLGNLFVQTAAYADPHQLRERIWEQLVEQLPELFQLPGTFATKNVEVAPVSQSSLEAFEYFLRHGRLPWYYASDSPSAADELLDEVLTTHPSALRKRLEGAGGDRLIERLTKQFRVVQWARIGEEVYPDITKPLRAMLEDWTKLEQRKDWPFTPAAQLFGRAWRQEKVMNWVFRQLKAGKAMPPHQFLKAFLEEIAALHEADYATTLTRLDLLTKQRAVRLQQLPDTVKRLTENKSKANADTAATSGEKPTSADQPDAAALAGAEEQRMPVEQVGLVLLWPYLRSFFEKTALLADGVFKDKACQERAVAILHYMASGTAEVAEHQAVFPKVLCGWPVDQPIHRDFTLLPEEEQESKELLRAVIKNWAVLQQTSPEGFRSAFLDRRGLMQIEEDRLHLFIERKGVDVLLDRLPWAISNFKLPWQPKPFFVEW